MRQVQVFLRIVFNYLKIAASPPLTWEKGATSVDIEDEGSAFFCEVAFSFAFDKGVVLKDTTTRGCKGK